MTTWYKTENDCEHLWLADAAELTHDKWSNLGPFTVAEGQIRPSRQEDFHKWTRNGMCFKLKATFDQKVAPWTRSMLRAWQWLRISRKIILDYTMIKVKSFGSPCRCQQKRKQSRGRHKARVFSILPRRYFFPKKLSLSPKQTYTLTYTNSDTNIWNNIKLWIANPECVCNYMAWYIVKYASQKIMEYC